MKSNNSLGHLVKFKTWKKSLSQRVYRTGLPDVWEESTNENSLHFSTKKNPKRLHRHLCMSPSSTPPYIHQPLAIQWWTEIKSPKTKIPLQSSAATVPFKLTAHYCPFRGGGGQLEQHPHPHPYQGTEAQIPPAALSKFIASLYHFCLLLKSRPALSLVLFQHFTRGECQLSVPGRSFPCTLAVATSICW